MVKFVCCVLFVLVTLAAAQESTTIDIDELMSIFNFTPTTQPSRRHLEDKPTTTTESPTTPANVVKHDNCECIPFFLCDRDRQVLEINGKEHTNNKTCPNAMEVCCKVPKNLKANLEPINNTESLKDFIETHDDIDKFGSLSLEEKVEAKSEEIEFRGCGYSNPAGLGAMVIERDSEAKFGEFPWVVALLGSNHTYIGVGVLIHPQVVMTAAHIASQYSSETLKIRAGEWDTHTIKEMYEYQERDVQEIYVHADFKPESLHNDVTLLRLQSPLKLTKHINTLCLPNQDESFDDYKNCVANGWGKDSFGSQGRYSVVLKKVVLDMVPHERCNDLLQRTRLGPNFKLHSSFVCAGGEEGKDTCKGDGGAPLACPISNNRYKLSGLVSWGIRCGQKDVPAAYASVAAFRQWVDSKMNQWGYDENPTNELSASEIK